MFKDMTQSVIITPGNTHSYDVTSINDSKCVLFIYWYKFCGSIPIDKAKTEVRVIILKLKYLICPLKLVCCVLDFRSHHDNINYHTSSLSI